MLSVTTATLFDIAAQLYSGCGLVAMDSFKTECLKEWAKSQLTTENTEFTEIFKRFFSVFSVHSVVKRFGKPTTLDTLL